MYSVKGKNLYFMSKGWFFAVCSFNEESLNSKNGYKLILTYYQNS